jgi:hypothetical protein
MPGYDVDRAHRVALVIGKNQALFYARLAAKPDEVDVRLTRRT